MGRRHFRRGVSWLELVLIVVILLVIAAFVWPYSSGGKASARRTACMSNMKMAGMSVLMYCGDWDDRLPPAATWATANRAYAKDPAIYHCPEIRDFKADQFGHAFRSALQHRKSTELSPSEPMLFDSTDLSWDAHGGLDLLPPKGRHPGGKNSICFVDGHTQSLTNDGLFAKVWAGKGQAPAKAH